ncbi:hypothetical protein HYQ46_006951 [Verticillium longisporum]|nr:hypothetical protein HYQ46_006951 [Verticillium longisporum]
MHIGPSPEDPTWPLRRRRQAEQVGLPSENEASNDETTGYFSPSLSTAGSRRERSKSAPDLALLISCCKADRPDRPDVGWLHKQAR